MWCLLCVVANGFIERQKLQIQGNTVTVSLAVPTAAEYNDNEDVQDDILLRTVIVHDVPADMEDTACVYLENPKKHGGPIESSSYSEDTKRLTVCFDTRQGMHIVAV